MGTTINITDPSGTFENNVEPTWALASEATLPVQSSYPNTGGTGNIKGRSTHLADIFKAGSDILFPDGYDPKAVFVSLMSGDEALAVGLTADDANGPGAQQYFGSSVGVGHLSYADAPDLSTVDTVGLNIPNPYVPDISNGAQTAADYKDTFESSHPGTRNSYPPAGATPGSDPVSTNLDLNAGGYTDTATDFLSPSKTRGRVGGWMADTTLEYGRWVSD